MSRTVFKISPYVNMGFFPVKQCETFRHIHGLFFFFFLLGKTIEVIWNLIAFSIFSINITSYESQARGLLTMFRVWLLFLEIRFKIPILTRIFKKTVYLYQRFQLSLFWLLLIFKHL